LRRRVTDLLADSGLSTNRRRLGMPAKFIVTALAVLAGIVALASLIH